MQGNKIRTTLVDFDNLNLVEAAMAVKLLSQQNSFSYVVTPNVDHFSRLSEPNADDALIQWQSIYKKADICLCDSRILQVLLKLVGSPIEHIVPGSDLTAYLFEHVLKDSDNIVILGAQPEEINSLKSLYPSLSIQHINPSMGFINKPDEVERLVAEVIAAEADYVFLAVGSPRQEVFTGKLQAAGIKRGVALCIGASINFIIGTESRAPEWMQKLRLEWLYRMLQDPKRLAARYGSNGLALPRIYQKLREKSKS